MPTLSGATLKQRLETRAFTDLFVEELGWDRLRGSAAQQLAVDGETVRLEGLAQKREVPVYLLRADTLPDRNRRRRIERELSRRQLEHLLIFLDEASGAQVWQWVKREAGKPDRVREHPWRPGMAVEGLRQKLDALQFTLEEEEAGRIEVTQVTQRLRRAFDADKVTKRFYAEFKARHDALLAFLKGLPDAQRSWYASVTLNRLMFVWFIQKKGFVAGDPHYLKTKLAESRRQGKDQFFRGLLGPLFFRGFAAPIAERTAADRALLGDVPYLNGGLFQEHQIEREHGDAIVLPDKAFEDLFAFFDGWTWHLDERDGEGRTAGGGQEINPDVLGYIFEKYVNQKQMGAYYTKEDVTEYICANTVLPRLLDKVRGDVPVAFRGEGSVWRLLAENPDRYIWPSVRHGADLDLPPAIAAGVEDVAARAPAWDRPATRDLGLPTETWREVVHRRERLAAIRARLAAGEIADTDALVTANLDIHRFVADAIGAASEDQIKAWWQALTGLTVLDPACGSGAFLFAALNLLEPLYTQLFDAMETAVADAELAAAYGGTPLARKASLAFFRGVLAEAAAHANTPYFVLRQIALNNLYGVDIMEEAAEICKLRLFLKLVAQLDDPSQIEPLPDLDFNIRSGNSLVGVIADEDFDRIRQKPLDFGAIRLDIQEKGETAALVYDRFRSLQMQRDPAAAELRDVKDELGRRLEEAASSSNRWIARQYGANPDQPRAFQTWLKTHEPFNWWTEYMGVMRSGGFDVVVGNPPYVARNKVPYHPAALDEPTLPDIYGNFVLRTLRLTSAEGRCGLIIPMSLTFGEDFSPLRDALKEGGTDWLSSYDIPAAIFSGVSQRCTIWLHSPHDDALLTSIMQRWRAEGRDALLELLTYYRLAHDWPSTYGIPKLREVAHERVLGTIKAKSGVRPDRVFAQRGGKHSLGYAVAARNFISVFDKLPPELDASTYKPIVKNKAALVPLVTADVANAALAITASEGLFWYWLVRGDGFDVTGWIVRSYIGALGAVDQRTLALLAEVGGLMAERRNECLVFKKNAGKYVGNLNYASLADLRRAADDLFLSALGVVEGDREAIYDHVRRVLAINESAGEKAIPPAVKAKFPTAPIDSRREGELLQRVRSHLGQMGAEAA